MKIFSFYINSTRVSAICLFVLLQAVAVPRVMAGNGDVHLGIQSGLSYPRILDFKLMVTKETRYHDAYEFFAEYFTQWNDCNLCGKVCKETFWKSRYALSVGGAYKPCVKRGRNSFGRLRVGADLGTNTRHFMLGVELGYEHVWTLRSGVQIVFEQKNEFNFWAKPTFINGFTAGVRLPI